MTIFGRNRFAWTSILSALIPLLGLPVAAQDLTQRQVFKVADCALHGGGGWVDENFYDKGKVRFSYISERSTDLPDQEKDPRDIYVAFWNHSRTAGEMLVFAFHKNSHGKDFFLLNNQGHIVNIHGALAVRDALWGIWTHQKLQSLLPKLRRRPLTILAANRTRAGSSVCKTPFDLDRVKEWDW